MSTLYEKSQLKLELNQVLTLLSDCADSPDGKVACLKLKPSSELYTVRHMLDETSTAFSMCMKNGSPGFSDIVDVGLSLDRTQKGGILQPKELLSVGRVLRCARTVNSYLSDKDEMNILSPLFMGLSSNKYLEDRILGAILSEDQIADSASPGLSDIRRHIRIQSGKIKESLQKIISSPAYSKFLREPIITIRQGRYVVPVKSECKNDIPGLIHDVSATGSTYFIEPTSAVNANNTLKELDIQENKEIERILAEISSEVSSFTEEISSNYKLLIQLDVIFAKAKLAMKMNAWSPVMNDSGRVDLRNARHPLIDSKKVVPITVRLGSDFDSMIITGPNTGGKTVTLKTVGLLTLMAECGLHIPASEGSSLSTYDSILADIGDEQSIAQSLSTFSSHMKTIVEIVECCDNRTLVLFDELGAGTDPAEGAALAIALIEHCRKLGANVLATTHYAELKLYAMRTAGVINASCEFDVDTLQPTYRLLIGVPGKSNAFAISRKLGLDETIIKEASDLVGKNDRDFDDVLSQLETQRQQMESARLEAEKLRQETLQMNRQSEAYNTKLQIERDKILEQARREAKAIIEDARRTANYATDEIKAIKKHLSDSADVSGINQRQAELRRQLNETEDRILSEKKAVERTKPTRPVMVGDTVELLKLGTKASVIAINKDGTYQLQAGILKLSAKEDEVYLLEHEKACQAKGGRPAHSGKEMNLSATASEVDLRGMDSIEAVCVLERYLDEAMRGKLPSVRIIHGKGTGVLRTAVHQSLKKNRFIRSYRLGVYGEGEDGVTIAEFR